MFPSAREQSEPCLLVVIVPALLLFGLMLPGTALVFIQNFEQPTAAARWIVSTASVLLSAAIVCALLRALFLGSSSCRNVNIPSHP